MSENPENVPADCDDEPKLTAEEWEFIKQAEADAEKEIPK